MFPSYRLLAPIVLGSIVVLSLPSSAVNKSEHTITSFAKYTQIPGATAAGSDACTACHADIAKDYRHAFHAQQGVECEQRPVGSEKG